MSCERTVEVAAAAVKLVGDGRSSVIKSHISYEEIETNYEINM